VVDGVRLEADFGSGGVSDLPPLPRAPATARGSLRAFDVQCVGDDPVTPDHRLRRKQRGHDGLFGCPFRVPNDVRAGATSLKPC
jgi:hypothetical protein